MKNKINLIVSLFPLLAITPLMKNKINPIVSHAADPAPKTNINLLTKCWVP